MARWSSNLRGDLWGGLASAVLTIPLSVGFGLLAKGRASVKIVIPGGERERRLVTFAPGTVFEEMALLDRESRSASLRADEDLVCYVLPFAGFSQLNLEHPGVAIKLLTNLGRELSYRLRRANRTIYQLEI